MIRKAARLLRSRLRLGLWMLTCCGFPWRTQPTASPQSSTALTVRRAALASLLARWPKRLRLAACIGMCMAWPLASLWDAWSNARATTLSARLGMSLPRLACRVWLHALRHSVPPVEALAYRQLQPGGPGPDAWLYGNEFFFLARDLTDEQTMRGCSDKHAFAQWCAALGVPTIPTLALATNQTWLTPLDVERTFGNDLLVKPVNGSQGVGIEVWRLREGRLRHQGQALLPAELAEQIRHQASHGRALMVQPFLRPHPLLAVIAGNGMPALRIITLRSPSGRVELGPAMLQAPLPGQEISQSGSYLLVDTACGRVLPPAPWQRDPVFAFPLLADVTGVILPDWDAISGRLLHAHAELPGRAPLLGWDVLFTDQGPVMCEANVFISFYMFQAAEGKALGDAAVGRVLGEWLQ